MEVIIITRRPECQLCDLPLNPGKERTYRNMRLCLRCYAGLTCRKIEAGRLKEATR